MRPIRCLLLLASCLFAFVLLLALRPWHDADTFEFDDAPSSNIRAYFNWRTPSSLFPPSAIISLTDDNSTFFLARPAAFGPSLPAKSLSGPLWIGSGFGDDHLGRGNTGASAEGELGCSDVPGWDDGTYKPSNSNRGNSRTEHDRYSPLTGRGMGSNTRDEDEDESLEEMPSRADGTDDHLHHPRPASAALKARKGAAQKAKKKVAHADIQSLQESAEIAGKVVLLSRGGCGFLEKVKWAQRRGGVALIVGDDIRGGPLVTMYARGDTSNVTIPALFTSHTTAHLLSSLIPNGGFLEDLDEASRLGLAFSENSEHGKLNRNRNKSVSAKSQALKAAQEEVAAQTRSGGMNEERAPRKDSVRSEEIRGRAEPRGWIRSFFSSGRAAATKKSRSVQGDSKAGWVLQDEFDDLPPGARKSTSKEQSVPHGSAGTPSNAATSDGFRIGVHDWRDPDMMETGWESLAETQLAENSQARRKQVETSHGGSGTGSGHLQNEPPSLGAGGASGNGKTPIDAQSAEQDEGAKTRSWFSIIFHIHADNVQAFRERAGSSGRSMTFDIDRLSHDSMEALPRDPMGLGQSSAVTEEAHRGLWLTLTPTSMSSSPFFDTLLVLVVSPLVTLTVVYALLLLRSRIRRRRWRAPKSAVERLPVRTYQTISTNSSATGSSAASITSTPDATTPLLAATSQPTNARPRPRARAQMVADVPQASSLAPATSLSPDDIEEKRAAGLTEWRRRYGGKQRECVVCLEEYVDGVSRVMSLPCGHEFHAECITPWLTTRRRTCPICKGDVVRSLARSENSAASASSLQSNHDTEHVRHIVNELEDTQLQAALTVNDDPASHLPLSREDEALEDLERGVVTNVSEEDSGHAHER